MTLMLVAGLAGANATEAAPTKSRARKAETFSGWRFVAPAKYRVERTAGHVVLTRPGPNAFCAMALFPIRPRIGVLATEMKQEWSSIIDGNFTATHVRPTPAWPPRGGTIVRATSATMTDTNGERVTATHYTVAPPGMVGSVLVTSADAKALARCTKDAKSFIASLEIDPGSLPPDDPDATPPSPVGTWTANTGDAETGTTLREYTFSADGTYRFRAEERGRTLAADQSRVIDENGTYSLARNRLTLIPSASTATLRTGETTEKPRKRALERVTYTWAKRYRVDAGSWALLLFPAEKTARDGDFPEGAEPELAYTYAAHSQGSAVASTRTSSTAPSR